MTKQVIKVLHINTEKGWRGGENQLRLFVEKCPDSEVLNYFAGLENQDAIKKFQNLCPVVPLPSDKSIFNKVQLITKFCIENEIQIIDAQSSKAHTIALLVKRKLPKLKLVVHRRVDNIPGQGFLNKWKYRTKKVNHYVAISRAIKNVLIRNGIEDSRISVVPSATESTPFLNLEKSYEKKQLATAFSLDSSLAFFGNASALSNQKGYDTLIHAVKLLKNDGIRMHCFIAGDGDLRSDLEALRRGLDLDQDITFLGFIKEVPMFLSALDVLAVPSNNEGLGTIILDGIHAGCAVVASKVGGIPEMIIHQETGLLIEPGDASQLADSLKVLLKDKDMQSRLNKNAKELINKNFSIQAMINGNIQIYRDILSENF